MNLIPIDLQLLKWMNIYQPVTTTNRYLSKEMEI